MEVECELQEDGERWAVTITDTTRRIRVTFACNSHLHAQILAGALEQCPDMLAQQL